MPPPCTFNEVRGWSALKVLLVDKGRLSTTARAALLDEGFAADRVLDSAAGLAALTARRYDADVLDLGPAGRAGYALLREMRARLIVTPVLLLDGNSERPATGTFHLTVPDYLSQPRSFVVVLARL